MKGNPVELRLHQGLKFNALGFFCSVDGGLGLEEREAEEQQLGLLI